MELLQASQPLCARCCKWWHNVSSVCRGVKSRCRNFNVGVAEAVANPLSQCTMCRSDMSRRRSFNVGVAEGVVNVP